MFITKIWPRPQDLSIPHSLLPITRQIHQWGLKMVFNIIIEWSNWVNCFNSPTKMLHNFESPKALFSPLPFMFSRHSRFVDKNLENVRTLLPELYGEARYIITLNTNFEPYLEELTLPSSLGRVQISWNEIKNQLKISLYYSRNHLSRWDPDVCWGMVLFDV